MNQSTGTDLVVDLTDNRMEAVFKTVVDRQVVAVQLVNAADLETAIHTFGALRAQMAEPVPPELDPSGNRVRNVDYPNWWTQPRQGPQGPSVMLTIRDPGFGWLTYTFAASAARNIAAALVQYADAAEASG
jgi:hypothetical protein